MGTRTFPVTASSTWPRCAATLWRCCVSAPAPTVWPIVTGTSDGMPSSACSVGTSWFRTAVSSFCPARSAATSLLALRAALWKIPDWRRTNGRQYPLACCLSLLLCGYLAGCGTLEQYEEFGATLTQLQLRALRSWRNPKTRRYEAPRKTTLWRIATGVDIELFEKTVNAWLSDPSLSLDAIAVDGKALRATVDNKDGGSFAVNALNHRGSAPFFCRNTPRAKVRS